MSGVHKSERPESRALFLDACRNVKITTIRKCLKIPKRYKVGIIDPMITAATKAAHLVRKANRIHPVLTSGDAKIRRGALIEAKAELEALAGDIDDLLEMPDLFPFKPQDIDEWAKQIYTASHLIDKLTESDDKRYAILLNDLIGAR